MCRQTDLLLNASNTGKIINIKKGQFLAPWDMVNVLEKIKSTGNQNILLTERGSSFGYNNLVFDLRSLIEMKKTGYPIIFDATHSVQNPGGLGNVSGGNREYIPYYSNAAVTIGISGIFMEVHENPDKAPSDGTNMIRLDKVFQVIIKSAIFEFLYKPRTSTKIIIKEYLNASNFFIDISQTKYLNALLDKISKKVRSPNG